MISATPHLSSAPSSVFPSVTMISSPMTRDKLGKCWGDIDNVSLSLMREPSYLEMILGFTEAPGASGEVSTWAMSPTAGAVGTLPFILAYVYA